MLVVVPRSGLSGDMLLSALIDLGADERRIAEFMKKELGVAIRTERVMKSDVGARHLTLNEPEKHFSPEEMGEMIKKSGLGSWAKELSLRVLDTIIRAEQKIHGTKNVHFHELSHIDTLVDIMGCALALDLLGEREAHCLPLNVGRAQPATLEILRQKRMPFYSSTDSVELTTPTGAALISNIAEPTNGIPTMISESIGYGAGTFETDGEPNVLRILRGAEPDKREQIVILETNLDDVSGEILAYAAERLLEEGAKDVSLIPIIAKKGRPGVILKAICDRKDSERLARVIFEETGTLGIRESECSRHIASRSVVEKRGKHGEVKVKVGRVDGRIINAKPEFEDVKRLARKKGKPIKEILRGL